MNNAEQRQVNNEIMQLLEPPRNSLSLLAFSLANQQRTIDFLCPLEFHRFHYFTSNLFANHLQNLHANRSDTATTTKTLATDRRMAIDN